MSAQLEIIGSDAVFFTEERKSRPVLLKPSTRAYAG